MSLWWSALVGYAIGSLPIGFAIVRATRGIDLRREGSGSVGATNAYRTSGAMVGLVVVCVDIVKGAASVLIAEPGDPAIVAGVAAVVGHVYPVWLGFRGGKGVATATGVFGLLAPWVTALAAFVFVVGVAVSRYVSLGSVIAACVLCIGLWLSAGRPNLALGSTVVTAVILVAHRGNLARLWSGTERALGT